MFKQLKNIDSAFKHIRIFSIAFLLSNCVICCYVLYILYKDNQANRNRIYLLANDKLLDAIAVDRSTKLGVEVRDHVKMFHFYFYSLEPDDAVITRNITKALYLADSKAKSEYENLKEKGYYSAMISANTSQQVEEPDSIVVNINQSPWYFRYYGKLKIVRPTTIATRSLISEGYLRVTDVSDNNPHGFLIERWNVLENKDLTIEKR
ncbi:conjugative transposon TraK protein [Niastella vici]|uniref:Conjugative transposon TraK protein n=1 Tax=Niastella vici TaxID=1703345 RepID=A0A1V9G4B0_9BACT|nr:conjugative transposon protein TraK [Niastella vici]OQP65479.1 conjugative transposon TraK protein [Niastella vici]